MRIRSTGVVEVGTYTSVGAAKSGLAPVRLDLCWSGISSAGGTFSGGSLSGMRFTSFRLPLGAVEIWLQVEIGQLAALADPRSEDEHRREQPRGHSHRL